MYQLAHLRADAVFLRTPLGHALCGAIGGGGIPVDQVTGYSIGGGSNKIRLGKAIVALSMWNYVNCGSPQYPTGLQTTHLTIDITRKMHALRAGQA